MPTENTPAEKIPRENSPAEYTPAEKSPAESSPRLNSPAENQPQTVPKALLGMGDTVQPSITRIAQGTQTMTCMSAGESCFKLPPTKVVIIPIARSLFPCQYSYKMIKFGFIYIKWFARNSAIWRTLMGLWRLSRPPLSWRTQGRQLVTTADTPVASIASSFRLSIEADSWG